MDPFVPPSPPQPRRNLAEEITALLRKSIVSGELVPGAPLAEPVLAEQFGASRAPIREALIALERDGLVEFNERSRTRVRSLGPEDYLEIISMRAALEGLGARLAAARWTAEDSAWVEHNIRRQEKAGTLGELSHLDVEMHDYIVRLSGHRRLVNAWQGIRWQFEMYLASMHRQMQEQRAVEPRRITVEAHRALLAALASGRPKHAAEVMTRHIEGSTRFAPTRLEQVPLAPKTKGARRSSTTLVLGFCLALLGAAEGAQGGAGEEFFENRIRPLLVEYCYDCHSGTKTKGGLSLETRAGWATGGDSGPALMPGDVKGSLLLQAVRRQHPDTAMPPEGKGRALTAAEVADLETWVRTGALDPREAGSKVAGMDAGKARSWWAFQALPASAEPLTPAKMDAMIDARLTQAGLTAAPRAGAATLLRRAAFDLTGLPPADELADTFLKQDSAAAFIAAVERLLAAPQYGEKWGRHWLDVVRYADSLDSRGSGKEGDILDAWRYRDWVVKAFNDDLPYDQFVMRQIAGDVMAAQRWDPSLVVATSVYALGSWGNGDADKEKVHTDIVDDQIDLTGRAFLGLTLACARCHDHKFDPITTRDYYGLAGIFFSSHILDKFAAKSAGEKLMRIPLLSKEESAARQARLARVAVLEKQLSAGKLPLTEKKQRVAGLEGLWSLQAKGVANPSLTVNTLAEEKRFSTIQMPARSVAVHPGPQMPVSISWSAPQSEHIRVTVRLKDLDPNCGDGIAWALRLGNRELAAGVVKNGGVGEIELAGVDVKTQERMLLIIRPGREYTCDTTGISLRIEGAQRWDLVETVLASGMAGPWEAFGGESFSQEDARQLREWAAEKQTLERELAAVDYAQGMQEGGIPGTSYAGFNEARIHKRGRYDQLGETVPRAMPAILTPEQPRISTGSGRLELARWVVDARNPLTARVMVNRLWQHHFGEGLAATENNFGALGTPPSHPELLDALAAEFIRSGWSIKHMHRLIMATAAYQRSSAPPAGAALKDADNRLLSHQRRRRLTAEELRDAMLSAAGALDLNSGGESVRDVMSSRRTLYLTTIRSDRTSYQALFDGADPTGIVESRVEATVAAQSLFLLNHPFTVQQAERLSHLAAGKGAQDHAVVDWLCRRLFLRPASSQEARLAAAFLPDDPARWTALCQMLLCSNEFVYVD